jgi:hypothetical protein
MSMMKPRTGITTACWLARPRYTSLVKVVGMQDWSNDGWQEETKVLED